MAEPTRAGAVVLGPVTGNVGCCCVATVAVVVTVVVVVDVLGVGVGLGVQLGVGEGTHVCVSSASGFVGHHVNVGLGQCS